MRRYWPLVGTGLLCLAAGGALLGQTKTGAPQTGDVFSSGGGGTPVDPRKYVSPDGRFLDRCAYDTATIPDNPYTRMYGMPDHVPIDVEIMKQYARCAVDACAINKKAVCWGKTSRQYPSPPSSPDSFNSNGFTNCQADGLSVVCDPPMKMLEILPAVCLGQNAMCETKVVFKLFANHDTAKMSGYYDNYGKKLAAMSGQTDFKDTPLYPRFKGTMLYVDTPEGFTVGAGLAGPVKVRSTPQRFTSAVGYIDPSTTNLLVITELRDMAGAQVLAPQQTIRIGLGLTPRR